MPNTSSNVLNYSHQTFQEHALKFDTNSSDLEQKTATFFISKMHVQEPDSLPDKKQESINNNSITEPSKRFEIPRETVYTSSSKPRKLRGKYTKYLPFIKEAALAEVSSGASINQVSKKYGIKYGTLKNWYSLLRNWMNEPTDPNLLYHEFFALQDAKNLAQILFRTFHNNKKRYCLK